MKTKKILFLYTELAGYFLACANTLAEKYASDVYIVRWKVNKEAPFDFNFSPHIKVYERADYDTEGLVKLIDQIKPDVIYCSGWIDKGYVKAVAKYSREIPVVVGLDNQWTGSLRQQLATMLFRFRYKNIFSYAWVSGKPQRMFAEKLGFDPHKIREGVYAANVDWFNAIYQRVRQKKEADFPKRFIYVGRYYDFKGVRELWNAFIRLHQECPNDWELWCLGVGDIEPVKHPKIKHLGFIQPNQMDTYIDQCGVFILPSRFEPWGVALHEYAAAGFPLVCSDKVGAATSFLKEGVNGYCFKANDENDLFVKMKKIINASSSELNQMGMQSATIAQTITPHTWAETILGISK